MALWLALSGRSREPVSLQLPLCVGILENLRPQLGLFSSTRTFRSLKPLQMR